MINYSVNKILTVIVVYFSIQLYSYAEVIKKIEVDGNKRVNTETIKVFAGVKNNDNLSSDDLNEVLKRLYETKFFENISLSIQNSILKISVIENSIIQNLIITGIENKTLKKKLFENITLKEKNPYVENEMKNNLDNIKNILQEVGYYFSSVEILKKDNDNSTIDLIFEVDLGNKAFINEIVFLGDKKF